MSLEQAMALYLEYVKSKRAELKRVLGPILSKGLLGLEDVMSRAVKTWEESEQFDALYREVLRELGKSSTGGNTLIRQRLSTLLRRKGVYLDAEADPSSLAGNIRSWRVKERNVSDVLMLSLPWVKFGPNVNVSLGKFRLRTYTPEGLASKLENTTRQAFYPSVYVPEHELALLSRECWLEVDKIHVAPGPTDILIDCTSLGDRIRFTELDPDQQRALRRIVLLNWEDGLKQAMDGFWFPGLRLGTAFCIPGDPFEQPLPLHRGAMAFECCIDENGQTELVSVLAQVSAPDWDELPNLNSQIDGIESQECLHFLTTAMDFVVKGSCSDGLSFSGKVDQILYHVFALDSVLGRNGDMRGMANRAARMLRALNLPTHWTSVSIGKSIEELVKELYCLRSKIVHGTITIKDNEVQAELSWAARSLARLIVRSAVLLVVSRGLKDRREFRRLVDKL